MNERLNELAIQAGIEFTYDPTETPMRAFAECWADELEKFAELIVAEVLAVQEKFIANGHNAWHLNKPTKNHFGISE
jgi:hypothetical protein